ncbi:MAG: hypothetical protein AAGB51_10880 [Planctomycetota bacterium]
MYQHRAIRIGGVLVPVVSFGAGPCNAQIDPLASPFPATFDTSIIDPKFEIAPFYGSLLNEPLPPARSTQIMGDVSGDGIPDLITPEGVRYGPVSADVLPFVLEYSEPAQTFIEGFEIAGTLPGGVPTSPFVLVGYSAAFIGDVSGDGIGDFAITNGSSTTSDGAWIIFGRERNIGDLQPALFDLSTLDGTNGFAFIPTNTGDDRIGLGAAELGDFNGDGIGDLAIASQADFGPPGNSQRGRAFVIFGRDVQGGNPFPATIDVPDFDGTLGFVIRAAADFDDIGETVAGIDLNQDGLGDIAVGSSTEGFGDKYIVYGRNASVNPFPAVFDVGTLDGTNGFMINGRGGVANLGDLNGDGYDELLTSFGGSAFRCLFGRPGSSPWPALYDDSHFAADQNTGLAFEYIFPINDQRNYSLPDVHPAGDVNADGIEDLIVGTRVLYGRDFETQGSFPTLLEDVYFDGTNGFETNELLYGGADFNSDGASDLFAEGKIIFGRRGGPPPRLIVQHEPVTYEPAGRFLLLATWDRGVNMTDADVTVLSENTGQPLGFAVAGTEEPVTGVFLLTPLIGDAAVVTIRDTATSTAGTPIDGDGDGMPGGDLILRYEHARASVGDITTTGATLPGQTGFGMPDGKVDLDDLGYYLTFWLTGIP